VTSAVESVAVPRARPRPRLPDAPLRTNPRLTLIPFAALSQEERGGLGKLTDDPTLYGALRDEHGAVKVVDHESALLLESLREPTRLPGDLQADEISLVRLVLDGVLELETASGEFVSGSRAYDVVCDALSPSVPTTRTARLSQAALRYAQRLDIEDALRLSARLYFYGRLPAAPDWLARLPSTAAIERFLGIESQGRLAHRLQRSWRAVALEPPNDGWFLWRHREGPNGQASGDRFKLYVSPLPESVPTAFAAAVDVAGKVGAVALKVGNDATSLLRPDKIILYFAAFDGVAAAAARLSSELAGCPSQGVPFTAELADSDGLLSWGMDPPRSEHMLEWQERESWRLWVTNRLALAMVAARRDGGVLEPWQYALARVEFDGIDATTWTPHGDLWAEAT
jgi:hypothetical protein